MSQQYFEIKTENSVSVISQFNFFPTVCDTDTLSWQSMNYGQQDKGLTSVYFDRRKSSKDLQDKK